MNLRLEIDPPLAVLTIDRPAKRNAMSFEMWSAIPGLVGKVEAEEPVRVLIIRGTDHFSAGADISEFATFVPAPTAPRATAAEATPTAITGSCVGGAASWRWPVTCE